MDADRLDKPDEPDSLHGLDGREGPILRATTSEASAEGNWVFDLLAANGLVLVPFEGCTLKDGRISALLDRAEAVRADAFAKAGDAERLAAIDAAHGGGLRLKAQAAAALDVDFLHLTYEPPTPNGRRWVLDRIHVQTEGAGRGTTASTRILDHQGPHAIEPLVEKLVSLRDRFFLKPEEIRLYLPGEDGVAAWREGASFRPSAGRIKPYGEKNSAGKSFPELDSAIRAAGSVWPGNSDAFLFDAKGGRVAAVLEFQNTDVKSPRDHSNNKYWDSDVKRWAAGAMMSRHCGAPLLVVVWHKNKTAHPSVKFKAVERVVFEGPAGGQGIFYRSVRMLDAEALLKLLGGLSAEPKGVVRRTRPSPSRDESPDIVVERAAAVR